MVVVQHLKLLGNVRPMMTERERDILYIYIEYIYGLHNLQRYISILGENLNESMAGKL